MGCPLENQCDYFKRSEALDCCDHRRIVEKEEKSYSDHTKSLMGNKEKKDE